jgi:hypothetical protein
LKRTVQGDAVAQPATRESHHVVDQRRHPPSGKLAGGFLRFCLRKHPCSRGDEGELVAQIMAEHGDELLPQFRALTLVQQPRSLAATSSVASR